MTTELIDLAGEFCLLALRVVTRTPRAAGRMETVYYIILGLFLFYNNNNKSIYLPCSWQDQST
jgi:hypothetical protein